MVDIVAALIQQPDYQTARKYWKVLKNRLKKEGSQSVTDCHQLKMMAGDGKLRLTDVADPETLLRIIQSVPSPKAEPIKLWLAKVGYERIQDMGDPARSLDRARQYGRIAKRARCELEQKTGKPVVTSENFLPPKKNTKRIITWTEHLAPLCSLEPCTTTKLEASSTIITFFCGACVPLA